MKHRVRIHGKKPKESQKRQAKPAPKKLVPSDVVKAVRHRDWPTVRQALLEKVDPHAIHIHGDPLILAVTAIAPVRVVQAVLNAGADPNARNLRRETALFYASDPKTIELLLAAGADPNHRSKLGQTPLHILAAHGLPHGMELLIAGGASLEARDDERRTPLLRAIAEQQPESVEVLLRHGASTAARNKHGCTALHEAAALRTKAAEPLVTQLLAAGADVNARCEPSELTPLMLARLPTVADSLVRAGTNVSAATATDVTALHYAVHRGDKEVTKVLLQAKADIRTRAAKNAERPFAGKTPLEMAAEHSSPEMCRLLQGKANAG